MLTEKHPIPLVQMAGFVTPMFDYAENGRTGDLLYTPCEAGHGVFYAVWLWSLEKQSFICADETESREDAVNMVRAHHETLAAITGVAPYTSSATSNEDFSRLDDEI